MNSDASLFTTRLAVVLSFHEAAGASVLSGWSWYSLSYTSVRQGIYIWKGVSKLQIVIVFSAKKKKKKRQGSAETPTAVPCHGGQSSMRKQWVHLPLPYSTLWQGA